MTKNPNNGMRVEDFQTLLKCVFDIGAEYRKTTQEAYNYPLNHPKYQPNIKKLAEKWPDPDSLLVLHCAYQAGQKASAYAGSGEIDLKSIKHACDDLEHIAKVTGKGAACTG